MVTSSCQMNEIQYHFNNALTFGCIECFSVCFAWVRWAIVLQITPMAITKRPFLLLQYTCPKPEPVQQRQTINESVCCFDWFLVHWFAWKQVKRNMNRTLKEKEQQRTISLLDFETLQKTKMLPYWRADRSGP